MSCRKGQKIHSITHSLIHSLIPFRWTINLCIKIGLNACSRTSPTRYSLYPMSWRCYLRIYFGGSTVAEICPITQMNAKSYKMASSFIDARWFLVQSWSKYSFIEFKNEGILSYGGNMLKNTRLQRNGQPSRRSDNYSTIDCWNHNFVILGTTNWRSTAGRML